MFDEIDAVTESEIFQVLGQYITHDVSLVEAAIELSIAPATLRQILSDYNIDVREPTKEALVEDAAECLESREDGEGYQYNHRNEAQLEEAISAIAERINVDLEQFRLSEQKLWQQIKQEIWEAKTADGDTAEIFWSTMDNIHRYLGTQDRTTYNIVFPLNILYADVDQPDEYQVLGQTVDSITADEWVTCCEWANECEETEAQESEVIGDENDLEVLFEDAPNQLDRSGQTYWMFEIDALDYKFAINTCVNTLRFLLGRINFALTRGKLEGGQFNRSVWNTRWMDLRLPFVYLIFEDNEYSNYLYSRDPTPRDPVQLFGRKADLYENYIDEIPPMKDDRDKMESRLVSAVYSFQDAVTNTDREHAFLDYWRAAERLTLTSETDTTSTVVLRARTVARTSNVVSQSAVIEKRNKLVHEGESVEITTEDTNTVKDMLEELILLYVEKSTEWEHEDFLFFFEHGDKSDQALDHLEEVREDEVEMINEISSIN